MHGRTYIHAYTQVACSVGMDDLSGIYIYIDIYIHIYRWRAPYAWTT